MYSPSSIFRLIQTFRNVIFNDILYLFIFIHCTSDSVKCPGKVVKEIKGLTSNVLGIYNY